ADSLGDCYCQSCDVITPHLDLTGVHTGPQLRPDVPGTDQDVGSTPQCPAGGVKGGQEAISHRLHLMAPVATERSPDHGLMVIGETGPAPETLARSSVIRPRLFRSQPRSVASWQGLTTTRPCRFE